MNKLKVLIAGLLASVVLPVQAQTYTYDFGTLLSGSFTPTETFASLSVTTTDHMSFSFRLEAYNLDTIFYPGSFIGKVAVNLGTDADPVASSVVLADGTWGVSQVGLNANSAGPGGSNVWDFNFTYPTAGNAGGAYRLTAFEEVEWLASFTAPVELSLPPFALHVQALDAAGNSAWYTPTTPIPEPQTYAMLLAGLALLAFAARRNLRPQAALA